jgi:hypothetical protein
MNTLELHILRTLVSQDVAYPEDFEFCKSTLALLTSNGLVEAREGETEPVYRVTPAGRSEYGRRSADL